MKTPEQSSTFFTTLVRATKNALLSAQNEFSQEWTKQSSPRIDTPPATPKHILNASPLSGNTSNPYVVKHTSSKNISPDKLEYLRSVYLKPSPMHVKIRPKQT